MKKSAFTFFISVLTLFQLTAEEFTIGTIGNSWSPSTITVQIGDRITIQASSMHPATHVSEATWNANESTPIGGSFAGETSQFTFAVNNLGTIYYVCDNHVASDGMKGKIIVAATTGVNETINKIGFNIINNPVSEYMRYEMESEKFVQSDLTLYDLKGVVMVVQELSDPQGSISLDLPAGQYIYVLRNREAELLASGKIIIAR